MAQISLILASNDHSQARQLAQDLCRSKYIYLFSHHADRKTLVPAMRDQIVRNAERLPTVVVIDYKFAGKDCETLLRLLQRAAHDNAIECVLTNPPADPDTRRMLEGLGGRLFFGDIDQAVSELALN